MTDTAADATPAGAPTTSFPADLIDGYQRFTRGRLSDERERYRKLAREGQRPRTMVIACCDSRAAPETIFDVGPGELFVVRNVANLVPPYEPDGGQHSTSAAIEFAVVALKVERIVVLGHGRCGGIAASLDGAMEPLSPSDFIGKWIGLLRPEAERVRGTDFLTPTERQTAMERLAVRGSIARLREFPLVEQAERDGALTLGGAWFDIESGELWVMDPATGDFERPDARATA